MPCLFLLCTTFLLAAFFGNVLWGTEQFTFRDGAHFYYPLYRYIQDELAAGRLPLWMPYEYLGQPLAGNPAAGLFYPGKLLFFLPWDFTTLYHWFIVLHVFGAAVSMYRLVRFCGKSEAASTLAAIVYAFGGSVIYQHLNVIFLIGAAWFPELIRLTLRQKQTRRFSCGPAVVIALMILGGDVQAAYHAGLTVLFLLGLKKSIRPLLLAFLLAAVQILPAWELARESNRTQTGVPRSLWEIPFAKDSDAVADGLLCRDFAQKDNQKRHAKTAYNFSVPPWRLAEMIWPNIGGKPFPENSRWFSACPEDRLIWVPSLYCSIPGLIFAVIGGFRRHFKERSLALIFLGLTAGSFGLFGLGWLFGEPNSPVGGIYWLMNLLLPGYTQFRYPAKLLTTAAIPFAVLAACGFDQVFSDPKKIFKSAFWPVFFVLFVSFVLLAVLLGTPLWNRIAESVPKCPMFGPFQAALAKSVVIRSLLHTIVVLAIFVGILQMIRKRSRLQQWGPVLLVFLCGLDLYLANRWMIPTVDRRYFTKQSTLLEKIARTHHGQAPPRVYRYTIWYPPQFRNQTSENRLAESVVFDRESLWPKYSLENRVSVVEVQGTMSIQAYLEKLRAVRSSVRGLARLGVGYMILPARFTLNDRDAVKLYSDPANDVVLWQLEVPGPTAWISGGSGSATIVSYTPNRIMLEAESAGPQTLILAEQYWPGWKAKVSNEQGASFTRVFPVDKIFRGIEIPSGKCSITFYYDPFLLKLGAVGTFLGWIFVIVGFFWKSNQSID